MVYDNTDVYVGHLAAIQAAMVNKPERVRGVLLFGKGAI